jgi:lysine 2,3-aminomutase
VVVSGGDVANVPWHQLELFLLQLLDLDSVRDIRLATKALIGLPQHWLQPAVLDGLARVARVAHRRGVSLALHTHANHAASVTPLVAEATRALLATGIRDVRNQGVLLKGVNDNPDELLNLCFALHGEAGILPYYFYLCDIIPNAEHWRVPLHQAQRLQEALMGYLPGYATPRVVCDVPYVGKRWVHQAVEYDREHGISYWTKNYQILTESNFSIDRRYPFYDPISSLPESGRAWWSTQTRAPDREEAHVTV